MCTVTYLPIEHQQFLFTSNRDESPQRAANSIQRSIISNGKTLLYPQDRQAKGTWIAISDTGQLVCILNGAFVRHQRRASYRMSRGLMALQFFDHQDAPHFFAAFDFMDIEPFTMIIYDQGLLYDLHWDEADPHVRPLDPAASHIWSSCTLYTPELQAKREQWFADWQRQQEHYTSENITNFHRTGGEKDPENDLVMSRYGLVQTTSITHVKAEKDAYTMEYHNLLTGQVAQQQLKGH